MDRHAVTVLEAERLQPGRHAIDQAIDLPVGQPRALEYRENRTRGTASRLGENLLYRPLRVVEVGGDTHIIVL
jgi:hypothetical protein